MPPPKNLHNDVHLWELTYGNQYKGHVSSKHSIKLASYKYCSHDTNKHNEILKKINSYNTKNDPKHIQTYKNNVFVSCLDGRCIMHYIIHGENLKLTNIISTNYKCVSSICYMDYLFFTESSLSKTDDGNDYLNIYDLNKSKMLCKIHTKGKWSKSIKISDEKNLMFITNWFSNDLTVFDISDISDPNIIQIFKCGISPRSIDFNADQTIGYVSCYYSRNIIEFRINKKKIALSWIGEPYDYPRYSGNMRDIIVKNDVAYISNMGRNKLLAFNIKTKKYLHEVEVGKYPNSIILMGENILTTCFLSDLIYIINNKSFQISGVSQKTSSNPVGLAQNKGVVYTTSISENKLELWRFV